MNTHQNVNKLNRCVFCKYFSGSCCMATPNSAYCKQANDEYYQYLHNKKAGVAPPPVKSLRKWDRK